MNIQSAQSVTRLIAATLKLMETEKDAETLATMQGDLQKHIATLTKLCQN